MRIDKKSLPKGEKKTPPRGHKRGVVGYSKKSALLEDAITQMNAGKYGRSSAALKELLALDPRNTEARRLFATLHLRLGSLVTARQAFESLAREAIERQDYWLAESLLREYLAAGPRCVPFLELLAHVFGEKGDAMAAVAELGKAIDILVEDPDPDNPQKPGQLYAKIRELAPASPVAFRFATMFDIQTGEFLTSHSQSPAQLPVQDLTPTGSEGTAPQPHVDVATEVMPWEQVDETVSATPPPPTSFISTVEPVEIQSGMAPPPTALEEQFVAPVEPAISDWTASQSVQDIVPSPLEPLNLEPEQATSQSVLSTLEHESSTVDNHSVQPPSDESAQIPPAPEQSEEFFTDGEPSTLSSSLSSPMPWEQVEESTIRIAELEPEPLPSLGIEQEPLQAEKSQPEVTSTAVEPLAASLSLEETPAGERTVAQSAAETSAEPPALRTSEESDSPRPTSFSWEAIFHKAWAFSGKSSDENPSPDAPEPDPSLAEEPLRASDGSKATTVLEVETSSAPASTSSEPTFLLRESGSTGEVVPPPVIEPVSVHEPEPVTPILETAVPSVQFSPESELQTTVSAGAPDVGPVDSEEQVIAETAPAYEEYQPSITLDEATSSSVPAPSDQIFSAVAQETIQEQSLLPIPEPVPDQSITTASTNVAALAPASAEPAEPAAPPPTERPSHWSTGEVAVQHHRPSRKKRQWEKEITEHTVPESPSAPSVDEPPDTVAEPLGESVVQMSEAVSPPQAPIVPEEDTRPEWVRESESITFVRQEPPPRSAWEEIPRNLPSSKPEPVVSAAASAVDVLFESTDRRSQVLTHDRLATTKPRPRFMARLHRVRIGILSFIGSCFSTTRSIVISLLTLVAISVMLAVVAVGVIGIVWMVMEEPPSTAYQSLTTGPQRSGTDTKKNSYFILLGFEAPRGQDAAQAGYERKSNDEDLRAAQACLNGDEEGRGLSATSASSSVVKGWLKNSDPAARFKGQTESVRSWIAQESTALGRYQQWLKLPFEDWGFGEIVSPNCAHILLTHRLYLAEGFSQDLTTGLERLETDMEMWRSVLAQSKTLMFKMLAADAVLDDAAIASGLLVRPDLDDASIARLGKVVRPLDQVELSVRWPMQSYFTWATKTVKAALKEDRTDERPLHVSFAAAMSLPVQRRSNHYADYYEAANRAVAEGRYTNLPKMSNFIRTQAISTMDYLANPLEHIIGIEPLPSWDPYVGRMAEADAQLRLASLQVWIRRGPQEGALLTRLAKAGQSYYDPFTGLPMLVNSKKGLMYSVGRDGKDQDGDPTHDVVAMIPPIRSETGVSPRTAGTSKAK